MIIYTNNGQLFREDKKTLLKPRAINGLYKSKGCENIKVRVIG